MSLERNELTDREDSGLTYVVRLEFVMMMVSHYQEMEQTGYVVKPDRVGRDPMSAKKQMSEKKS